MVGGQGREDAGHDKQGSKESHPNVTVRQAGTAVIAEGDHRFDRKLVEVFGGSFL